MEHLPDAGRGIKSSLYREIVALTLFLRSPLLWPKERERIQRDIEDLKKVMMVAPNNS